MNVDWLRFTRHNLPKHVNALLFSAISKHCGNVLVSKNLIKLGQIFAGYISKLGHQPASISTLFIKKWPYSSHIDHGWSLI